ncbi:hypothetical protein LSH36_81g06053 [Paralvinella palmiformis]|uniref:Tetratricopeptide repeat protein 36 n=1 Tax=Paralvinella palmiformis TaxID=53620 RepID=A0AAD9NDN0_9ANNE|nr:hypothetical protein LSH36_81g06053 [Paralvinella palmiformis]
MEKSEVKCSEHNLSVHDKTILDRIFNPNLPVSDLEEEQLEDIEEPETESILKAKQFEVEGVKAAEAGDIMLALDYFNKAIEQESGRPSGYNNRAQAFRLLKNNSAAKDDLEKAVELSNGRGKAACQAYTQLGLIHRLLENDEAAKADFQKAANLGGVFAKQMLISLNPYAALCNQMMAEMISKVKKGEMV